jgi:hypothetical protein
MIAEVVVYCPFFVIQYSSYPSLGFHLIALANIREMERKL